MSPTAFPEANTKFNPPEGIDESQCQTIPAYLGVVQGGNMDGSNAVVVAWQPSPEDRDRIAAGAPIFLMSLSGLPVHSLSTTFPLLV